MNGIITIYPKYFGLFSSPLSTLLCVSVVQISYALFPPFLRASVSPWFKFPILSSSSLCLCVSVVQISIPVLFCSSIVQFAVTIHSEGI